MSGLKSLLASPRFSIVLGLATILIVLGVGIMVSTAYPIAQSFGDENRLTFFVDKSVLLLGSECTTVRWQSDNLPLVYPLMAAIVVLTSLGLLYASGKQTPTAESHRLCGLRG